MTLLKNRTQNLYSGIIKDLEVARPSTTKKERKRKEKTKTKTND